VPTGIALAPGGGVYVGFLTPAPYVDGSSKVVKVSADGAVTDVWTGLTMITALTVGADGALYALEMATGNTDQPPYVTFGTGRVLRQTGANSSAEVATGLDFPIAMAFGPDGGLYVSTPAFGGDEDPGGVLRFDVSAPQPIIVPDGILNTSTCANAGAATPPAASPVVEATPAPPAATETVAPGAPVASPPPASGVTGGNDGKGGTGAVAVTIQNFAFNPPSVEIPAGTVVTWTNLDSVPHTATAANGTFDSGNLNPGQSFSFTFTEPGTIGYGCSYHPSMVGTIVVQ
jgi:plastocyanin